VVNLFVFQKLVIIGKMRLDELFVYYQAQADPNQWNGGGGGYYGYAQGYENYGYAPAGQDPNVYGSYPGYPGYQPPQQQQQIGYS